MKLMPASAAEAMISRASGFRGAPAEHHRSERDARYDKPAIAEPAERHFTIVLHDTSRENRNLTAGFLARFAVTGAYPGAPSKASWSSFASMSCSSAERSVSGGRTGPGSSPITRMPALTMATA